MKDKEDEEHKDIPTSEGEEFKALRSYDLWESLRKFANRDITLIAQLLHSSGPLTLGELRDKTRLPTNKLNHDLTEMRSVDLVKKIEKKYYLTKYAAVLLNVLERIREEIKTIPEEDLIKPLNKEARSDANQN
jgi:DNA-binding transcriptional regulator GbsR (MarR family)